MNYQENTWYQEGGLLYTVAAQGIDFVNRITIRVEPCNKLANKEEIDTLAARIHEFLASPVPTVPVGDGAALSHPQAPVVAEEGEAMTDERLAEIRKADAECVLPVNPMRRRYTDEECHREELLIEVDRLRRLSTRPALPVPTEAEHFALNELVSATASMQVYHKETALAKSYLARTAAAADTRGVVEAWITDRMPQVMPDYVFGFGEGDDEEDMDAQRCSEDVLACELVTPPQGDPYTTVVIARYFPRGQNWYDEGGNHSIKVIGWLPLPAGLPTPRPDTHTPEARKEGQDA